MFSYAKKNRAMKKEGVGGEHCQTKYVSFLLCGITQIEWFSGSDSDHAVGGFDHIEHRCAREGQII